MFGYFTILGAIPGFFLSSLTLMALWGVRSLKLQGSKKRLSYGYADNHHPLAGRGTSGGSGWSKKVVWT